MPARPTLSVTFDNLGEAADVELGLWPHSKPQGRHPSVVEALPRVLELLAHHEACATFFVEGVNAESYPAAIEAIAAGGHELGLHAWRHERWDGLDAARERELLERGTAALAGLGHRPVGFRPPGGRLTRSSPDLLREQGYGYVSPLGETAHAEDGLAYLPFQWPLVDAYHHYPGPLRRQLVGEERGGGALPARVRSALYRAAVAFGSLRGGERTAAAMTAAIERLAGSGGQLTLIFHPFLLVRERSFAALRTVLERATRSDIQVQPLAAVAAGTRA